MIMNSTFFFFFFLSACDILKKMTKLQGGSFAEEESYLSSNRLTHFMPHLDLGSKQQTELH